MKYTKAQLEQQIEVAKNYLASAQRQKETIQSSDFALVRIYGEEVRQNHLTTANNSIEHWQKRIIDVQLEILKLEATA